MGYQWLLYLVPESHKARGLLQCVSQIRSEISFSHVVEGNVISWGVNIRSTVRRTVSVGGGAAAVILDLKAPIFDLHFRGDNFSKVSYGGPIFHNCPMKDCGELKRNLVLGNRSKSRTELFLNMQLSKCNEKHIKLVLNYTVRKQKNKFWHVSLD